jgi:Replication-relaxation
VVTSEQIATEFWPHASKHNRTDRRKSQQRVNLLCNRHLIYSVFRTGRGLKLAQPHKVYYLGRHGAEILARLHPRIDWLWVGDPEEAKQGHLPHSLGMTDLFLDLQSSSAGLRELQGREIRATMLAGNYWTSQYLVFGVGVPKLRHDGLRMIRQTHMRPDAFCVLGIQAVDRERRSSAVPSSFAVPFFIEYDRGSHPYLLSGRQLAKAPGTETTSKQIASYLSLANDRGAAARFPQLDVPGYVPPLLYVTRQRPGDGLDRSRALKIKQFCRQYIAEQRLEGRPPVFVAARNEVAELGLEAAAIDLWTETGQPLYMALINPSLPLIGARAIDATTRLEINPEGAAWHGPRAEGRRRVRAQTRLSAEQAKRERQGAAAYEARFAAAEARRRQAALPKAGDRS